MSSIYSGNISVSIFGESHGAALGAVLDGFPAGIAIRESLIRDMLARRAAKRQSYSTGRSETDSFRILSGVSGGYSNGSPLCAIIENHDVRPEDYRMQAPRPSHADYTAAVRYAGFNAPTGGGHFSGRITAALVITGALCSMYLEQFGVKISAHIYCAAGVYDTPIDPVNPVHAVYNPQNGLSVISERAGEDMLDAIKTVAQQKDSAGGIVECLATGVRAGIGSPNVCGLENKLSMLAFSVPAVKGIEFGAGFSFAKMRGSTANDAFISNTDKIDTNTIDNANTKSVNTDKTGSINTHKADSINTKCVNTDSANNTSLDGANCYNTVRGSGVYCGSAGGVFTDTNHSGGINGGITNGMPVIFRTVFRPTPSIGLPQRSVDRAGNPVTLAIEGRHDPCIVPRAVPVMESVMAIVLADLYKGAYGYGLSD